MSILLVPGLDQKLFFLINRQWTSPLLDRVMVALSSFDLWLPIICVLIVAAVWFGGFKMRAAILTALVAVSFNEGVVVGPLKKLINRPRPHQTVEARTVKFRKATPKIFAVAKEPKVKITQPETDPALPIEGRSFPSGHTTNNFAVAIVFAFFFRRWGWLYFLVAAAIGYSRIYTASHWPTDVGLSVFIGLMSGGLTLLWATSFWRRRGPIWFPALYRRHPNLLNSLPSEANLSQSYHPPK